MNIIGDVKGKTCVLVDDMVDTAGTLCVAAQALKNEGRAESRGLYHARDSVREGRRAHLEARFWMSSS